MSNSSQPSNPNSGPGAGTPCDVSIQSCPNQPVECPTVEIEINNTPASNDDMVQLKCTRPSGLSVVRYKVACRIRASSSVPGNATIVLTNPDGHLRFPDASDTTITLSIPPNGSWVAFEISGESASKALNDAVIEAHCNTATG